MTDATSSQKSASMGAEYRHENILLSDRAGVPLLRSLGNVIKKRFPGGFVSQWVCTAEPAKLESWQDRALFIGRWNESKRTLIDRSGFEAPETSLRELAVFLQF